MENNAGVLSSSAASLAMPCFLERTRHPSAADIVESVRSFIVSFLNNASDPETDSATAQEFFTSMDRAFRAHPLWAGCPQEELDSAGEGLEKYVMTKIFTCAFVTLPEDVKHDDEVHEKIALIQQFIEPEHLDIKPSFQNETSLVIAQKELQKINKYKAPRDKLACILNCCRLVNNLLLNAYVASNDNPPGADEFLSLLIYVTIKRYRRQSRLVSEAAYFFTNMFSAESFIWSINAKSFSMEEAEFEKNMECARAVILGLSLESSSSKRAENAVHVSLSEAWEPHLQLPRTEETDLASAETTKKAESECTEKKDKEFPEGPSMNDLEEKCAAKLSMDDKMIGSFRQFRFLYAQLSDLTLDDVEALLCSYKQLVLKYMALSTGLSISNKSIPTPNMQTQSQTGNKTEGMTHGG